MVAPHDGIPKWGSEFGAPCPNFAPAMQHYTCVAFMFNQAG